MCRNLDRMAGRSRLSVASIAFPVVTRVIDMRVDRRMQLQARTMIFYVAPFALPRITRGTQIRVRGYLNSNASVTRPGIATLAFPPRIGCRISCEGVRRNDYLPAGVVILLEAAIALPTIIREMSMRRDDDGRTLVNDAVKTSFTVPVKTHRIQVSVGGDRDDDAARSLPAITKLTAVSGINVRGMRRWS